MTRKPVNPVRKFRVQGGIGRMAPLVESLNIFGLKFAGLNYTRFYCSDLRLYTIWNGFVVQEIGHDYIIRDILSASNY